MGKVGEGDSGKARVEEETQGHKAPSQPRPSALKEDYEHVLSTYRTVNARRYQLCLLSFVGMGFFFFFFGPKKYIPNSWHALISFGCACFVFSPQLIHSPKKKRHIHNEVSLCVASKRKNKKKEKEKLLKIHWSFTCSHLGACKIHAWDCSPVGI